MTLALQELGIAYQIGGSVASSAYGVARTTIDADVISEIEERHVDRLVNRLSDEYYIDGDMIRQAIGSQGCFNVIHLKTMIKVDVFVRKDTAYDRTAFSRRRMETLTDAPDSPPVYLASPEDVVLHKLYWYRLGDHVSERQWNDLMGVLRVSGARLDMAYMRRWSRDLQVDDLLQRAITEAGLDPRS